VGGFFPLTAGNFWRYAIYNNAAMATTSTTVSVGSSVSLNGTMVQPVTTTEYVYPSIGNNQIRTATPPSTTDYAPLDTGLWNYNDPGSGLPPAVFPYVDLTFPARPGVDVTTVNMVGSFSAGFDVDGDGKPETATLVNIDNAAVAYEAVSVPAGNFHALHMDEHLHLVMILSASGQSLDLRATMSWYLAPGIGPVKTYQTATATLGGAQDTQTSEGDLLDGQVGGVSVLTALPPGNALISVPLVHNDLVYDALRNVLYASLPGSAQNGNSIAVIDPASGAVVRTIAVGSEPKKLALSGDDQYLYVSLTGSGSVARVNLTTMATDLQFSLGNGTYGPNYAADLAVLPGAPASVAVVEAATGISPSYIGIALFDGATMRPVTVPGFGPVPYVVSTIAVSADGSTLYGLDTETTAATLARFSISQTGLTYTSSVMEPIAGAPLSLAGGKLYTGYGAIYDALTLNAAGVLPGAGGSVLEGPTHCVADAPSSRVYCPLSTLSSATLQIAAYDAAELTLSSTLDTRRAVPFAEVGGPVRYGSHGLALREALNGNTVAAGGQADTIYLIQTTLVP